MQTVESVREIVDQCRYLDWIFFVLPMGDGCFLQVAFRDSKGEIWKGRKWYISFHSVESEIVQTAFKAVLTAIEHEAREAFTYKDFAVFGPHHDVNALIGLAQQKR